MNRIKEIRNQKGFTLANLVEATGIPRSTIGSYETKGVAPSAENAKKLAEAMGVSIAYLVGYEEPESDYKHLVDYSALEGDSLSRAEKWQVIDELLGRVKDPQLLAKVEMARTRLAPVDILKLLNLHHALKEIALSPEDIQRQIDGFILSRL